MSLKDLFLAGGPVMWPLLLFSIATVAMVIERSLFWSRLLKTQNAIVRQVISLYRSDPSLAIEKLSRHLNLPIPRIFHEALSLEDADSDEFALAIDGAIQAEIPILKRFNDFFDLIVGLSPLLGLLGTVTGLMQSFSNLTLGGVDGSKAVGVTSGISVALITTAFGLIVAIAAFAVASIFRSFYTRQLALIQENVAEIELLYRRRQKAFTFNPTESRS
ncbi:MAG: biopolymer transporter ExbB [Alkalinema sp. CACIAM 70d]|nr:MotA/TolQ/ExbB proton channel family protein [Alkalinema sp. FACHB-956]OUC11715.1 MAG: biopolymer transporter ExbB [Alkalinema sp. CACIAM 70d]